MFGKRLFIINFVILLVICEECRATNNSSDNVQTIADIDDGTEGEGPGNALFLTPFIEQGQIIEGRQKALVPPFVGKVKSFAGYLTVNKRHKSNLFFWYFESEGDPKNDPVVIWLQGGLGNSSLLGVFLENGPYSITTHRKILKRETSWSKISNIVYFDNPVGSGYSFTHDEAGYATNQTRVGEDLYNAIVQFLELFPYLQNNDLFIAGEYYAGKYIPAVAHNIHLKNKHRPQVHVNLKGLMIGNGFTDPINMMQFSEYLYQIGLIDWNAKRKLHQKESLIIKYIKHNRWHSAYNIYKRLIKIIYFRYSGLRYSNSGIYNYVDPEAGNWTEVHQQFVTGNRFRRSVHVGNLHFNPSNLVFSKFYEDIMKSVVNLVPELLKNYRILFYNGEFDIICPYPATINFLRKMNWSLKHEYQVAKRHRFYVNGEVGGYFKNVGNLTDALIRNAGLLVPADQPVWGLRLLQDFMNNNFSPKTTNDDDDGDELDDIDDDIEEEEEDDDDVGDNDNIDTTEKIINKVPVL